MWSAVGRRDVEGQVEGGGGGTGVRGGRPTRVIIALAPKDRLWHKLESMGL